MTATDMPMHPGSPIVNYWELYNEPDIVKPFVLWGTDARNRTR